MLRYVSLQFMHPEPFQPVLATWDKTRMVQSPKWSGVERRQGLIVDRFDGQWMHMLHGSMYRGYFPIPGRNTVENGHRVWNDTLNPKSDRKYLLYFDAPPDNADAWFFFGGPMFIGIPIYYPDGMDWKVILNHRNSEENERECLSVPAIAPSRWMQLPNSIEISDAVHNWNQTAL